MDTNLTAARAARRFLADRVRDDWDWPNAPDCWSASDEEVRGVTEFRERYYGTTSEPESEAEGSAASDPYQFDSPDSISDAIELKTRSRKRKRREVQEEEMDWNVGLQCFVQRRDAWTGAAAVKKYGTKGRTNGASDQSTTETPGHNEQPTPTSEPTIPPPEASSANNDRADPLIPLALPLLPDNPIRASIKPKVYADIYNNIVVTNRTPSVPVNLSDMTQALVVGWKENGEWPPKAAALDALIGARKRDILTGVKMENGEQGPFLAHHPHVKRGMDSVKRIFHLNGHSHPENEALGKNG